MPSITLTDSEFQSLPDDFQRFLMAKFYPGIEVPEVETEVGQPAEMEDDDKEHLVLLNPTFASEILEGLSLKTKNLIRYIVTCPGRGLLAQRGSGALRHEARRIGWVLDGYH